MKRIRPEHPCSPAFVAVLFSAILLCVCLLAGCGSTKPNVDVEPTGNGQEKPTIMQGDLESEAGPEDAYPTLRLDDPTDRAAINNFLTYLTMAFYPDVSFAAGDAGDQELTLFAVTYLGLNGNEGWEDADGSDIEIADGFYANNRIDADRINEIVREYFGREIDFSSYSYNPDMHYYEYSDGYVYFYTTAPIGQIAYYGCATSVEDLGKNRYRVVFSGLTEGDYYKWDSHLAGCTYDEMRSELGVDGPYCEGEAVVDVTEDADGKHLTLVSLNMRRVIEIGEGAPTTTASSETSSVSGWYRTAFPLSELEPDSSFAYLESVSIDGSYITLTGTAYKGGSADELDDIAFYDDDVRASYIVGPFSWTLEIAPDATFEGLGNPELPPYQFSREEFDRIMLLTHDMDFEFHVTDGRLDYACFWS